jgi:hypothetical protein
MTSEATHTQTPQHHFVAPICAICHGAHEDMVCAKFEDLQSADDWLDQGYLPDNVDSRLLDPDDDTGGGICLGYDEDHVENQSEVHRIARLEIDDRFVYGLDQLSTTLARPLLLRKLCSPQEPVECRKLRYRSSNSINTRIQSRKSLTRTEIRAGSACRRKLQGTEKSSKSFMEAPNNIHCILRKSTDRWGRVNLLLAPEMAETDT